MFLAMNTLYKWIKKIVKYLQESKWRKFTAILLFCECVFYLRHKYLEYYVNHCIPMTITKPPNKKRIETILKYQKIYIEYFAGSHREWLSKQFGDCSLNEIQKENINKLIKYNYFLTYNTLNKQEQEWRDNITSNQMKELEDRLNYQFEEGYNDKIQSSYCLDQQQKIQIFYHPLSMYLYFYGQKKIANAIFLYYLKFKYKYIKGVKVWYKLNEIKKDKLSMLTIKDIEPMIMFGGVSVANPTQCIVFINSLITKYKNNNKILFVIDIPWAEMSITHFMPYSGYLKNKVPLTTDQITDIVFELEHMILTKNQISFNKNEKRLKLQWNLIGESYGTAICSAIYQKIKCDSLGIIPRLILIDAGILCVTDPSAIRFTVKEKDFRKWIFQQFVFREIMIATLTERYTHWMNYALYPHELINDGCNKQHIVISGDQDYLIPFMSIKKGIDEANKLCNDENKKIIHIIMKGTTHAAFLIHTKYQNRVIDLL